MAVSRKKDNSVLIDLFFNGITVQPLAGLTVLRTINGGVDFLESIEILQYSLTYCKQHGEQSAGQVLEGSSMFFRPIQDAEIRNQVTYLHISVFPNFPAKNGIFDEFQSPVRGINYF